jgi:hypothetical protein
VFVAVIAGVCVLLFVVALVAPRLSWWPQEGIASSLTKGSQWAGQAPGRAGRWAAKPFQKSRTATDKSAQAGRKSRGKLPF